MITFTLIAARSKNNIIGYNNKIPWHLPEDIEFFKKNTMGSPIIMGRKTYESIGRPLKGRLNIVVTRNINKKISECKIASSIDDAFNIALLGCKKNKEIFLIGGAEIYKLGIHKVNKIKITEIAANFHGDSMFPLINLNIWKKNHHITMMAKKPNNFLFSFVTYIRK